MGQQLIEDNIVSVSRQMIDKEASVVTKAEQSDTYPSGAMQLDGMEEEL